MAYVPVPKDLSRIQPKVMFNLTKRQLTCFGIGIAVGLPLFFIMRAFVDMSAAAVIMIFSMLPFFLLGMYEKDGQPLEAVLNNVLQTLFLRPKQRPYRTNNYYAALMRQDALDKEVRNIVRKTRRETKTRSPKDHAKRKKKARKDPKKNRQAE